MQKNSSFNIDDLFDDLFDEGNAEQYKIIERVYGGPQYHCVINDKGFGPVTVRQFANMARYGIVNGKTLVWKEGMAGWALASTVADLQIII